MESIALKAPFPYFGGKSRVAARIWQRFGGVRNYVEPFAGSLAVLLGRPQPFNGTETVNDACGFISNFWRALVAEPDAVAGYCDWPVNENDLHARHAWLVAQSEFLASRLEGDPDFFDARIAGWWVWGICCWIGSEFCSGRGPWQVAHRDGVRHLVHVGNGGLGVHRQRIHLGNAGRGVHRQHGGLGEYIQALSARLRFVRVCCGDWSRVVTATPTTYLAPVSAIFLDPPYDDSRNGQLYRIDSTSIFADVRQWAIEHGRDPRLRIALCGYDIKMPRGWIVEKWKAHGGYGSQAHKRGRANRTRETIAFSPHCVK